jgi:hypothetical protein
MASDYAKFINQYPENCYVQQAEDSLHKLFITDRNAENYYHFIQLYPNNKNKKGIDKTGAFVRESKAKTILLKKGKKK